MKVPILKEHVGSNNALIAYEALMIFIKTPHKWNAQFATQSSGIVQAQVNIRYLLSRPFPSHKWHDIVHSKKLWRIWLGLWKLNWIMNFARGADRFWCLFEGPFSEYLELDAGLRGDSRENCLAWNQWTQLSRVFPILPEPLILICLQSMDPMQTSPVFLKFMLLSVQCSVQCSCPKTSLRLAKHLQNDSDYKGECSEAKQQIFTPLPNWYPEVKHLLGMLFAPKKTRDFHPGTWRIEPFHQKGVAFNFQEILGLQALNEVFWAFKSWAFQSFA